MARTVCVGRQIIIARRRRDLTFVIIQSAGQKLNAISPKRSIGWPSGMRAPRNTRKRSRQVGKH